MKSSELTPVQVQEGKRALRQFCITSFLVNLTLTVPVIIGPTYMDSLGMQRSSGIILAAPYFVILLVLPVIDKYILKVSLEYAILQTNIGYFIAMCILTAAFLTTNVDYFTWLLLSGMIIQFTCVVVGLTAD
jgi:hypothetical protein